MAQILILKTLKANPAIFLAGLAFWLFRLSICGQFFDDLRRLRNRIHGRKFRFMERDQYIGHIFNYHHYVV
jgi:hypothetical protein